MNYTMIFEASSILLMGITIFEIIRTKEVHKLFYFAAGALFGLIVELINVSVFTDSYFYCRQFFFAIGTVPHQVPLSIALYWGMLIVHGTTLAKRLSISLLGKAFFVGFIGLAADWALDVVAVRVDGGMWTWLSLPLEPLQITSQGYYGVAWGNYFGWFIVLSSLSFMILFNENRFEKTNYIKHSLWMLLNIIVSLTVLYAVLTPAYVFSAAADGWLSVIIFCVIIAGALGYVIFDFLKHGGALKQRPDWSAQLFWAVSYPMIFILYFMLGLAARMPLHFILCVLFCAVTLYFVFAKKT
jgi:hypothetical protein